MQDSAGLHNQQPYSVSEISGAVKRTVEGAFSHVRIRGEIGGYRGPHSSGHHYFALKDDKAKIDAIIWRGTAAKLQVRPEEGMEVIATGKLTTYPGKSSYQITITSLEVAGEGALLALLEKRKKQLAAEGLFAPERKRPLPYLPRTIGVVTSPTGSVIRDILHRIEERFPCHVLVWPVAVQGDAAAGQIASAIKGFSSLPYPKSEALGEGVLHQPDILIIARGGGSIEDLWCFNEEIVARAVADCPIPIISAIGHETDTTLIDYVADKRAPTPTAAAEMAVPVLQDLRYTLDDLAARLTRAWFSQHQRATEILRGYVRGIPALEQLLIVPEQRLDHIQDKLIAALRQRQRVGAQAIERLAARIPQRQMTDRIQLHQGQLDALEQRLSGAPERGVHHSQDRLIQLTLRLQQASPLKILPQFIKDSAKLGAALQRAITLRLDRAETQLQLRASQLQSHDTNRLLERGFALVQSTSGETIRSAETAMQASQGITITFADGQAGPFMHTGTGPTKPAKPKTKAAPTTKVEDGAKPQGTLF